MKPTLTQGFILIVISLFFGACSHEKIEAPYNVLFILADDQRADALGAYGNSFIHTPHLDELAKAGVLFTNNYCMGGHHGAICAPSRAMIMSGKTLFNVYDKLAGVTTMPMVFGEHGYQTFMTGKWHNEPQALLDAFQEGKHLFLGGMSDHFNVPLRNIQPDHTFSEPFKAAYSANLFADATKEFLSNYAGGSQEKPFFAYMALTTPHDPRSPDLPYIGRYKDDALPLPENFLPMHPFDNGALLLRDENLGAWPRTPTDIKKQLADYYGLITHIDDRVGEIIQLLKEKGLYDKTIIIYTADHGLAVGSHGLLGKQSLYEHSMKSPLIIAGPGIPKGKQVDAFVYLYDLFPTLCSMNQIPIPDGVEGADLSALISGKVPSVRSSVFTAYAKTQRAVREERWKLIRYPQIDHTQLFDLKADPFEKQDLSGDPALTDTMLRLTALLEEWQSQKNDTLPLTAKKIMPKTISFEGYQRFPDQHQPDYTLERFFSEPMENPLLSLHVELIKAQWNGSLKGVEYDFNRFRELLKTDPERQKQVLEMITLARDSQWIQLEHPITEENFKAMIQ